MDDGEIDDWQDDPNRGIGVIPWMATLQREIVKHVVLPTENLLPDDWLDQLYTLYHDREYPQYDRNDPRYDAAMDVLAETIIKGSIDPASTWFLPPPVVPVPVASVAPTVPVVPVAPVVPVPVAAVAPVAPVVPTVPVVPVAPDPIAAPQIGTNKDRLELYDLYPMPNEYDGMTACNPTNDGRLRVRNPEGRHQCRIISKLKNKASGYELFHNKIKKWIRRKHSITFLVMENISEMFPNMTEEAHKKIFKEFLFANLKNYEFKQNFYNKLISPQNNIELSNEEDQNEFFEKYYTVTNLVNPKSQGIECEEEKDVFNKIKGLHSNRCILAYKNYKKEGFENYTEYLFNILKDMFPENIFFDKQDEKHILEKQSSSYYKDFFPDMSKKEAFF